MFKETRHTGGVGITSVASRHQFTYAGGIESSVDVGYGVGGVSPSLLGEGSRDECMHVLGNNCLIFESQSAHFGALSGPSDGHTIDENTLRKTY